MGALLAAALLGAAGQARAASFVKTCFQYQGAPLAGLATTLEYYGSGAWRPLGPETVGRTGPKGCVSYNLLGNWQQLAVRIVGAGVVSRWNAVFLGTSRYYAKPGGQSLWLGLSVPDLYRLPAAAPDPPRFGGVRTEDWLNDLSSQTYSPSPAMQVAAYMDANRLYGNVVVLDYDLDGVLDGRDSYPRDPTRW